MNVHHIEQKLESIKKLIKKLSAKNSELIFKFEKECYSHGLSDARVLFYASKLLVISRKTGKDLDVLTKENIKEIVAEIERGTYEYTLNKRVRKGKYSEWSKVGFKLAIKKFYQWFDGFEWDSKKYPERADWIRSGERTAKLSEPVILSKEEILRLFKAAEGTREKALVTFMYESGCRCPDELLNMKVSDIAFDDYGAQANLTSGKVGSRTVRVVSCVPYLKAWVENEHPNPKSNSYLWVNIGTRNKGKMMNYNILQILVRKWCEKAGIDKRITPYSFRRSRYTHLSTKIPTPALYKIMGQVQGSDAIRRYVALNKEDTDEAILSFYGIKNERANGDIKPLFCSRCGKQATPEKEFCPTCNAPLTEMAKLNVEKKKEMELKDIVEFLLKGKMKDEINVMFEAVVQKKLEVMNRNNAEKT